jgi:hypothetical protein
MHTEESLAALSDRELDAVVAEVVFGIVPIHCYPAYSSTWEGIGLIVEHMRQNGWTFALDVSLDNEWPEARFHHTGKPMGAAVAEMYPRAVAMAAVLAAQGKR